MVNDYSVLRKNSYFMLRKQEKNYCRQPIKTTFKNNISYKSVLHQHKATDSEAKGMSEKVNELQQEVQTLQTELVSASEKIDYLQRKNDEVKNKAQTKIQAIK